MSVGLIADVDVLGSKLVSSYRARSVRLRVLGVLGVIGLVTAVLASPVASASDDGSGPGLREGCDGTGPTPLPVEVTDVPIMVPSEIDDYFVLYARVGYGASSELPVAVVRGRSGVTTVAENVRGLTPERYRVEKYRVSDPADVDGDCLDDLTELDDPRMNPVNPATSIPIADGTVTIPDRDSFESLSYDESGSVKFVLFGLNTDRPGVYFMNMNKYAYHQDFLDTVGLERALAVTGTLVHSSSLGLYYFYSDSARPFGSFAAAARAYTVLAAAMPSVGDELALFVWNSQLRSSRESLELLRESRVALVFEDDVYGETGFAALNQGVGYGVLRALDPDDRPHPRDVVVYETLPNALSRVAGVVSTVPQTPLSHVNLRAVQDGIPNAFLRDALENPDVSGLVGSYVRYEVTDRGWDLRAATPAEVEEHLASLRPSAVQTLSRDLSVTEITPLGEVGFAAWDAFGVKAVNVAVLGRLGFPEGTVPAGFAIPFYFYDEFMKHNDLHDEVERMLASPAFQTDLETQRELLKDLRDRIEDGESPQWMIDALRAMHATYPEGQSLRYRSSTNNEDLPGFSGAGLYDSKTQDPDETEEDGIDKSLKGVYASLWNYRAFVERDFHRVDHSTTAMGVLVHPNYRDELVNGVAVSFDPVYGREGAYYVNSQVGEDLVTNPEALSTPEELLLGPGSDYTVVTTSSLVDPGKLLMSDDHIGQLHRHLRVIHDEFANLYQPPPGEPFAMEIEFKITSNNILAVKQARPWVFATADLPPLAPPGSRPLVKVEQPDEVFSDLADAGGLAEEMRRLVTEGIMTDTGCATGRLCPSEAMPRWEVAVWMVRVVDGADPAPAPSRFRDVDPEMWWVAHVERLAELGITTGCVADPALFCPYGAISRLQMAAFLARAFDLAPASPAGFEDTEDLFAAADVDSLFALGITVGCSRDPLLFCPGRLATRSHVAAFIDRSRAHRPQ